jgi:hypothetical protein|tara:strand:- start:285 stop:479 length:195 start_codon:yes stop_codon:yes gene_type:complete
MSDKKKKEIITNLENSIRLEKLKRGGQINSETLTKLQSILDSVVEGTYVSQYTKRAKRKPKVKK